MDGGLAPHAAVGRRQASQERLPCSPHSRLLPWLGTVTKIWVSRSHYLLGLGILLLLFFFQLGSGVNA